MIKSKLCLKCGAVKRTIKQPLCKRCYFDKSFKVWEGHHQSDINELKMIVNDFLDRIFVNQRGWGDLKDLNDIITWHYEVFHQEYVCEKLPMNEQLIKMLNDLKKFVANY